MVIISKRVISRTQQIGWRVVILRQLIYLPPVRTAVAVASSRNWKSVERVSRPDELGQRLVTWKKTQDHRLQMR